MSDKSIRVALLFAVSVCVLFAYSQLDVQAQTLPNQRPASGLHQETRPQPKAPSSPSGIIYTQPLSSSGILWPSSQSGSSADEYVWDGFTIQTTQVLTQVEWFGGYNPLALGSGGPVLDFAVSIYASLAGGSQPDLINPPLVNYLVGGNAGETPAGTVGGVALYHYSFTLPVSFTATGGTKYWLQIEAAQAGSPPDWGWAAGMGGDGQHFRRYTPNVGDIRYQLVPGDAAFTLLGPGSEVLISGLHASNDSPTLLGNITQLTATIASGSHVSYQWNFGDGALGTGPTASRTYGAAGFYTAIVTASNSVNTLTATTRITITDVGISGLTAANDSPVLLGNPTTLIASVSTGSNVAYHWSLGDGQVGSGQTLTHTYPQAGTFTAIVTATNSVNTLTATTIISITTIEIPITNLSAINDSPTRLGQATALTASVASGSSVAYQWNFGDGQMGTGRSIAHGYASVGTYTASVTASNSLNLLTATTTITVFAPWCIYLPILLNK